MFPKYAQVGILTGIFILQYLLEHRFPQNPRYNSWKNERYNLLIGVLNITLNFLPATALVWWLGIIDANRFGLLKQVQLPAWLTLVLTVLILDAWMYVWHRFNHRFPLLWRFHRFHHLDTKMNTTTAVRFHIVELLLSTPGKGVVYFIFGFSYLPVLVYEVLFFASVVLHHSNIRITQRMDDAYRRIFVSPRMHRIHHSNRPGELHSNFSSLFSFWDRLFGSWTARPAGAIHFGVDD